MMKQLKWNACGVLVLIAVVVTDVAAGPQSQCLVGKNKCVAKKAAALLKCEWKAETPGMPADPNAGACVDRAKARFDGGSDPTKSCFEKLENRAPNDCVTIDDTASVETLVDACVAQIVGGIDPAPLDQSKCNVGKKKCAARKLKSVLKCHQKAETPGKPNDPNFGGCLDKAKTKFEGGPDPARGCFARLEDKPGNDCLPPLDNTAAVEATVDDSCVGAFIAALETPTTTTTTTSTTSTTLPGPCTTLGAPCGSCGDGVCDFGLFEGFLCVSGSGSSSPPCSGPCGCTAEQVCLSCFAPLGAPGGRCVTPCP